MYKHSVNGIDSHFTAVKAPTSYQENITLIWNTESPLIQATNPDRVILPAPLTPINR